MNKLLSLCLATLGAFGIAGTANASICALSRENRIEINDHKCRVYMSGSMDSEHNKAKTYLPKNISLVWGDGVKTNVQLLGLTKIDGAEIGIATVDGKGHVFTRFYHQNRLVYSFLRLDDNLREKMITVLP